MGQPRAPPRLRQKCGEASDVGAQVHQFKNPEDMYRARYFETMDCAISCLRERVTDRAIPVLVAIESLLCAGWSARELEVKDLDIVQQACGTDMDHHGRLHYQIQSLAQLRSQCSDRNDCAAGDTSTLSASDIIRCIGKSPVRAMIPDVLKLCKLYLVNPATTATAERSFSLLRRLKTYLRSTMTQERLNHCLILHLYQDRVDNLNMKKLVNEFISSSTVSDVMLLPTSFNLPCLIF